jgi:hypothetical protein
MRSRLSNDILQCIIRVEVIGIPDFSGRWPGMDVYRHHSLATGDPL